MTPATVNKWAMLRLLEVFVVVVFGTWIWGIGGAFVAVAITLVLFALFHGLLFKSGTRLANLIPWPARHRRMLPASRIHLR